GGAMVVRPEGDAAAQEQGAGHGKSELRTHDHTPGLVSTAASSERCRVRRTKNRGTNGAAMKVAANIPPRTPVPIECREAAPAPLEIASGTTPRMKASEVMTIGRRRSRAASSAAWWTEA